MCSICQAEDELQMVSSFTSVINLITKHVRSGEDFLDFNDKTRLKAVKSTDWLISTKFNFSEVLFTVCSIPQNTHQFANLKKKVLESSKCGISPSPYFYIPT